MRKNKLLILFISLHLVLNSCGFKLRQPINLDFNSYALIGNVAGLSSIIDKKFASANIKKSSGNSAELIIEILRNDYTRRILTLRGGGRVGEYEISRIIEYRFKTKGVWSEPRKLESFREFTYDPSLYNAAQAEEKLLNESINDEISRSLITEINNLGK